MDTKKGARRRVNNMDNLDILIEKLANNNDKEKFRIYRISVRQKFWSFYNYYRLIYSLDARSLPEFGGSGDTFTGTVLGGIANLEEFNKFMNMYFDGFVMNGKSSLDSLAHAADVLYPVSNPNDEIYFNEEFIDQIGNKYSITKFHNQIKDVPIQQWFKDLLDFRNVTTHERVVEAKIVAVFSTTTPKVENVKIFLPDNVRGPRLAWSGRNELYPVCDIFKSNIKRLLGESKNAMIEDLKSFNKIPII